MSFWRSQEDPCFSLETGVDIGAWGMTEATQQLQA